VTEPAPEPPGWDCHVHVFQRSAPVRGGHYQPADRLLPEIEAEARRCGVGHLVLVQPSVYGTDNTLLLDALQAAPGRHRGVVVMADDAPDALLETMHRAGVRGARLNRVSPVGEQADAAARHAALAPRLHALGWHLQWYARAHDLPTIARVHERPGSPVAVLDHLAGLHLDTADDPDAWAALKDLAAAGAWVKLSGWYRLGDTAPYTRLMPMTQRLAELFGEHLVWGSDWPHTSFADGQAPPYASTWRPVVEALGADRAAQVRAAGAVLYR
jgi:predicted TIM-barrel fold metal-dependent hydrolase